MPAHLPKVLEPGDGLRLQSGPGRDLTFKVTGEDTGGAFDYFTVEVAPKGGPPLHVHHEQEETIHVLKGRYKVRIGDETFTCEEGGFAYLPSTIPHALIAYVLRHREHGTDVCDALLNNLRPPDREPPRLASLSPEQEKVVVELRRES